MNTLTDDQIHAIVDSALPATDDGMTLDAALDMAYSHFTFEWGVPDEDLDDATRQRAIARAYVLVSGILADATPGEFRRLRRVLAGEPAAIDYTYGGTA